MGVGVYRNKYRQFVSRKVKSIFYCVKGSYFSCMEGEDYFKGRGAQIKTGNKFLKAQYVTEHIEGLDEELLSAPATQIFHEQAKKVVNKVTSPDLGMMYSLNPYQGCERA